MQYIAYLLVYPWLRIISLLPFSLLYKVSDGLFFLIYRVLGYRRKVVRKNIRLAFPQMSDAQLNEVEKRFYHHLCDLFLEMIKTLSIDKEEIQKRFVFTNIELIRTFENQNRSIILTTGHYASYEWLISMGYHISHEGYAIYAPLSNKYFDRLVQRIRNRHNAFLLSRYDAMPVMEKHMNEGRLAIYGFANDQSPQKHKAHYWRTFMGVEVPVFTNAERIAKKYNLPLVHVGVRKTARGYYQATFTVISEHPMEVPDYGLTDAFTELLEAQIKEDPAFYLWTHNRFKHMKITDNQTNKLID